jgi:ribulose-5-phosphate 4-epimerase/fuculose-1-phosphate aldolase
MSRSARTSGARRMTGQPKSEDAIWMARVNLAAALRSANRLGLSEGICNHFSLVVPGGSGSFLLNPQGLHWSEICASDLIIVDSDGNVVEGKYQVEPTALYIHSRIHTSKPAAKCVLHTHMPYATALCCVENGRLEWAHQNALRFYGRVSYDRNYNAQALDVAEGNRISEASGGKDVLFLSHHGVVVTGGDLQTAFDDLYYLERACMLQVHALSTGLRLENISTIVCETFVSQMNDVRKQGHLHFEALKRILDREEPEYAD